MEQNNDTTEVMDAIRRKNAAKIAKIEEARKKMQKEYKKPIRKTQFVFNF